MRLFTALWPSQEAVQHLSAAVRRVPPERFAEATSGVRGFRLMPATDWHLTLCFHGDADAGYLSARLDRRVRRLSRKDQVIDGLRLRMAGAGRFRGVLWVGVEPAGDAEAGTLRGLVRAAGGDPGAYRGHLTVARWNRGRPGHALTDLLADYRGPWWTVGEVALVRSDQREGRHHYSTVHRVPLTRQGPGDEGAHQHP